MKRFLAIILAIVYFTASTGAAVNIHYCMGKLQSMDLWSKGTKGVCENCGMTNKKGCCEDKHQVVKLEKKYNIPVTSTSATKVASLSSKNPATYQPIVRSLKIANYSFSNSPPGIGLIRLFISNCVFRI